MKTTLIIATLLLTFATGCTSRTESETTVDSSGAQTSTVTESTTMPAVDTAATAEMKSDAKEAGQDAAAAGRDAANATGTAMEKAGQEIQDHSKPGNQP